MIKECYQSQVWKIRLQTGRGVDVWTYFANTDKVRAKRLHCIFTDELCQKIRTNMVK